MANELEASQDARLIRRLFKNMRKVKCKSPHAEGKCWESTYAKNTNGYTQIGYQKNGITLPLRSHRLSWAYHNQQEIPDHLWVCHHCDNPVCINPNHLFLGTAADNIHDAMSKGRARRRIDNPDNFLDLDDEIWEESIRRYKRG